jgi:hypothetical protein
MPSPFFRIATALFLMWVQTAHSQHNQQQPLRISSSNKYSYTRSPSATQRIETSVDDFVLWVDEKKWRQKEVATDPLAASPPPVGVLEFINIKTGGLVVKVITENQGIPVYVLRERVLANAKQVDAKAKIISTEQRIVNGRQVLALQMAVTPHGLPTQVLGYYYGGSAGTIQVTGVMIGSAIDSDSVEELTEFLNGLEISDEELPSTGILFPGLFRFNSAITIRYDPKKWKLETTPPEMVDDATLVFKSSSGDDGDVGIVVAVNRVELPMDTMHKLFLFGLHKTSTKVRIISNKTISINGFGVRFCKTTFTTEDNTPGIMLSYEYSGKAGSVTVYGGAATRVFPKYEKDVMDFLNGLLISE